MQELLKKLINKEENFNSIIKNINSNVREQFVAELKYEINKYVAQEIYSNKNNTINIVNKYIYLNFDNEEVLYFYHKNLISYLDQKKNNISIIDCYNNYLNLYNFSKKMNKEKLFLEKFRKFKKINFPYNKNAKYEVLNEYKIYFNKISLLLNLLEKELKTLNIDFLEENNIKTYEDDNLSNILFFLIEDKKENNFNQIYDFYKKEKKLEEREKNAKIFEKNLNEININNAFLIFTFCNDILKINFKEFYINKKNTNNCFLNKVLDNTEIKKFVEKKILNDELILSTNKNIKKQIKI